MPEEECEYTPKNLMEMILYKADRSMAILGIIVIGCWSLGLQMENIASAAVGGLVGYLGGRAGK